MEEEGGGRICRQGGRGPAISLIMAWHCFLRFAALISTTPLPPLSHHAHVCAQPPEKEEEEGGGEWPPCLPACPCPTLPCGRKEDEGEEGRRRISCTPPHSSFFSSLYVCSLHFCTLSFLRSFSLLHAAHSCIILLSSSHIFIFSLRTPSPFSLPIYSIGKEEKEGRKDKLYRVY